LPRASGMALLNKPSADSKAVSAPAPSSRTLVFARSWIVVSAFFSCSGWLLSAIGQLNTVGYGLVLAVGIALWLGFGRRVCGGVQWKLTAGKLRRRYAHAFPALFLLFACLAVLGGILYAPNNYDALTYRFPRILNWLAEHRWHWIATRDGRMNFSATGFEWLMTPLFALTGSDRFLFLINSVSYALLPGLTYATFIRLGVGKRQAWVWMWLLPCTYGLVLQAGSIGNDAFAVVYLLSSICFALKFRESGKAWDFWVGMIAAALLTGAKASNLPLLLPWALASLPSLRLLKARPFGSALVAIVCIMVSFLPVAWQNAKNTGDWTGEPSNKPGIKVINPYYGLVGNSLQLVCQNVMPPVMPAAELWNGMVAGWLQSPRRAPLLRNFPSLCLDALELQQEEAAGLGLGVTVLLAVTLVAGLRRCPKAFSPPGRKLGSLICLGAWIALLVYMVKMGGNSTARLLLPYYPLLIASVLLLPATARLARQRWWKTLAFLAALSALPALILTPSRPLWPALSACEKLTSALPGNALVERMHSVYSVYRNRNDGLAPLRAHLTQEDHIVGFLGDSDPETALWRPFGTRRVVDIPRGGTPPPLLKRPWRMVAPVAAFLPVLGQSMEQWLQTNGGRVIAREWIFTRASIGPQEWCVLQFDAPLQTGKE